MRRGVCVCDGSSSSSERARWPARGERRRAGGSSPPKPLDETLAGAIDDYSAGVETRPVVL
jgi:hypothetical protein